MARSRAAAFAVAAVALATLAAPAAAAPPKCEPYVHHWTYVSLPDGGGTYRVPDDIRWRCA